MKPSQEHISEDIAIEESMPTDSQLKKDINAVFVEYDSRIAMEKLLTLSQNQNAVEKMQYLKHLSDLVLDIGEECIGKLYEILNPLMQDSEEIKRAVLSQIHPLVKYLQAKGDYGYKEIIKQIVPIISTLLNDTSYDIKEEAGQEIANIAEFLNEKDRGEYFLTPVLAMSHDDENDQNRMIAVQLLSKMANIFGRDLCEQFIGLEFLSKGDDPQIQVRKEAVTHLNTIGKVVSKEFFNKRLLPFYLRLCKDQHWGVRKACIENACEISQLSENETRENQITEIYLKFLEDNSKWVKVAAYKNLGPFIATLIGLKVHEKLIENFLKMSHSSVNGLSNANEIIYECAFNFPAVLYTLGGSKWSSLSRLFKDLTKGPEKVKQTLACSLHEIAKIIGEEQTEKELFKVMEDFLKDPSEKIKYGVIKNLAAFIEVFNPEKRENMIEIFLQLQKDQKKWRIRELIANQIDKLANIFSKDIVFQIITPISFKLCSDPVSIVREEASKKIAFLLDNLYDHNEEYRNSIIANIKGFSLAPRFTVRQSFVFMCEKLMDNPERFQEHFITNFTALGKDKVPNVRILVAKALYEKHVVSSPLLTDPLIVELINTLKEDNSQDVIYWISKIDPKTSFKKLPSAKSTSPTLKKPTEKEETKQPESPQKVITLNKSTEQDKPQEQEKLPETKNEEKVETKPEEKNEITSEVGQNGEQVAANQEEHKAETNAEPSEEADRDKEFSLDGDIQSVLTKIADPVQEAGTKSEDKEDSTDTKEKADKKEDESDNI